MPCPQGIPPCTGFTDGSVPCLKEPIFDPSISNITVTSIVSTSTKFSIEWTGGQDYVRFILIHSVTGLINDAIRMLHDGAQPLLIGNDLRLVNEYHIMFRCENNLYHSGWETHRIPFVGALLTAIIDGIDYMIEGPSPNFVVDDITADIVSRAPGEGYDLGDGDIWERG